MSTRKYKDNKPKHHKLKYHKLKYYKPKHHKFRSKKIHKYHRDHKKTYKKYKGGNPVINFMNQGVNQGRSLFNKSNDALTNNRMIQKIQKMGNIMHDDFDRAEMAENKVKSIKQNLVKVNNKLIKEKQDVQKLQKEIIDVKKTLTTAIAVSEKAREKAREKSKDTANVTTEKKSINNSPSTKNKETDIPPSTEA